MITIKKFKRGHPIFFVIALAASVVMIWRGLWGLQDLYLFLGNPTLSFLVSTLAGLLILLLLDIRALERE